MSNEKISTSNSIDKATLAMLIFLGTEVMFFAGLISAFRVLRAGAAMWPPLDQPRYPVLITAINTLFLLFSGFTMSRSIREMREDRRQKSIRWLIATEILGMIFLGVQGFEWIKLVRFGLTFTSSIYGGIFYTLIGCHALHVLIAEIAMLWILIRSLGGKYTAENHTGISISGLYWYFVIGIWIPLYVFVYLI